MTRPAYKLPEGLKLPKGYSEEHQRRMREDDGRLTPKSISRDLRERLWVHFNAIDAYRYLSFLAVYYPTEYVGLFKDACLMKDDSSPLQGIQIIVQPLTIEATPTQGVLNSPITGHIQLKADSPSLRLVERLDTE